MRRKAGIYLRTPVRSLSKLLLSSALVLSSTPSYSQSTITWSGNTSTDWNTNTNWSGNVIPTAIDNVIIPNVLNQPQINAITIAVHDLSIQSNAMLTISTAGTLEISGAVNNAATGAIDATGSTINLIGTTVQAINAGVINTTNLTLNNSAGASISGGRINILGTYTPTSGILTTGGFLSLKGTLTTNAGIAEGNSSGGYINGNVTVERFISGGRRAFRFLGNPFNTAIPLSQLTDNIDITGNGGSTNGFTTTNSNNPSAFYYNPNLSNGDINNDSGWRPYTSAITNSWLKWQGMRVLVRGTKGQGLTGVPYTPDTVTINMTGIPNQGSQIIPLSFAPLSGFNVIANPFASPLRAGPPLSAATNIDGSVYWIWDPMSQGVNGKGAYIPLTIGNSATDVIPAFCGLLVKVSANTTVTFSETDKVSTENVNTFKTTGMPSVAELHITDSSGAYYDRIYIQNNPSASDSMEQNDGVKFSNPNANFYTLANVNKLSLDARPFTDQKTIQIGFTTNEPKKYVIGVVNYDMAAGSGLILNDKYLHTSVPLSAGVQYSFEVTGDTLSQGEKRFELGMTVAPNNIKRINTASLKVTCVPNPANNNVNIGVTADKSEPTIISLYSLTGQLIYRHKAGNVKSSNIKLPLTQVGAGMYIISVQHGSENVTSRIIKQ